MRTSIRETRTRGSKRKCGLDGCVEVEAAYYSVPPGFIGQEVPVQWDDLYVRILHPATGQLLREHLHQQQRGRHRVAPEDRSPKTPPGVLELLARARRAGTHIGTLCEAMHARYGAEAVRRIQGVLGFLKKYGSMLHFIRRMEQEAQVSENKQYKDYYSQVKKLSKLLVDEEKLQIELKK